MMTRRDMGNVVPFYPEQAAAILERLIVQGDLSRLTPEERATYYLRVCQSVGLNPLTQPFDYIKLNGKLKLYALKGCTDQLRGLHNISVTELERVTRGDIFIVTARVATPDGRTDEDFGCVGIAGLAGEALANAIMKAATKAKRRATLAICGLGLLDETEVDSIPGARAVKSERPPTVVPSPKRRLEAEFHPHPEDAKPPAPNRRLERDRTIDARYEAVIRADQKSAVKDPVGHLERMHRRQCEAETVAADAAEFDRLNPGPNRGSSFLDGPPPHADIPEWVR
jgi:hypothetical protein